MSEETYLTGKCPKCGEDLRVPSRLSAFSCMFCGAKLTPDMLVEELAPAAPDGDADALMERVRENLLRCVTDHPEQRKLITRKDFTAAFDRYQEDCRGVFDDLELACRIAPERKDAWIEDLVSSFLDGLEAYWRSKTNSKSKYNACRDDDKITIAVFLCPMVERLHLSVSEDFRQTLQKRWVERHPKSPFYLGSYDAIAEGFSRRFKLCFITTAVCREAGKADDCAELTAFRAFRDGYLLDQPDGPALVAEYYEIAPLLVTVLDLCGGPAAYRALRERYLEPCYADILAGRNRDCRERYVRMVRELEAKYLS